MHVSFYVSNTARAAAVLAACLIIIWLVALFVHAPARGHPRSAAPAAYSH